MSGFAPGKPWVFLTVAAVETASGEKPTGPEPSAKQRALSKPRPFGCTAIAEPAAKGISSVFEFETPIDATAEMKAELKAEIDSAALRKEGILDYLVLRHFKVPGVPRAVGFAFVSNGTAERAGLESGVARDFSSRGTACSRGRRRQI